MTEHSEDFVLALPPVDEGAISTGLYELSKALGTLNPEAQSHGLLGGEWGYGQDFANDVFEMFPYWWGDCECGADAAEWKWEEENPHADDCYQAELARRGGWDAAHTLAAEWGLPDRGCAVHCTCGQNERRIAWLNEHAHDERCPIVRPNFKHFASGIEVRWYKYIGRSMEVSDEVDAATWGRIMADCLASLSGRSAGGEQ